MSDVNLNQSFAPQGEDAMTLLKERTNIAGVVLESMLYGALVLLYILTAHSMLTQKNWRSTWKYLGYITIQLILATIGITLTTVMLLRAFVDNRDFPGGPIPWTNTFYNLPPQVTAFVCFTISTWLQDGFLLYRFLIIWQFNWFMFVIPFMMYLTSIAFSCILLAQLTATGLDINTSVNANVGLVFWSCSIGLNILLTALIVGRLLYLKRSVGASLGSEHTRTYMSIASMLVESAALYTVVGIAFLGVLTVSEAGSNILIGILGIMASFSPTLIAYRVSCGSAWTRHTANTMTSMVFTKPNNNAQSMSGVGMSTTRFTSMSESKMGYSRGSSERV